MPGRPLAQRRSRDQGDRSSPPIVAVSTPGFNFAPSGAARSGIVVAMPAFGITDHVEGPRDQPTAAVVAEVLVQTVLADEVGFEYAWFAEHHAHAHAGHVPTPLLLALHAAGRTARVRLGPAVVCLNLHHPLAVAEQCAVADLLMGGRSAFGFGSGSTPGESTLFAAADLPEADRHRRTAAALRLMKAAWAGRVTAADGEPFGVPAHDPLPVAADLAPRAWLAVNSVGAAQVAGAAGVNVLFSHLRTPDQYRAYAAAYRAAGGRGLLAANRPVHVGPTDAEAYTRAEPALRTLWRRFRAEGKIPAETAEPDRPEDLCGHPVNFLVGGPATVARRLAELNAECPFDVANVEVRWDGLSPADIHDCVRRLAGEVRPRLGW
jgi:alkanesulfonate monooxygenase SsuD/methylene tetrahydromethanopterin reductase-like flavin-dependent oxidoreductase (luciferase family)